MRPTFEEHIARLTRRMVPGGFGGRSEQVSPVTPPTKLQTYRPAPKGAISRAATVIVAPCDAQASSKAGADFVATGVDDDVILAAALASTGVGDLLLITEGTLDLSGASGTITAPENTLIRGMGQSTTLDFTSAVTLSIALGGDIEDLSFNTSLDRTLLQGPSSSPAHSRITGCSFDTTGVVGTWRNPLARNGLSYFGCLFDSQMGTFGVEDAFIVEGCLFNNCSVSAEQAIGNRFMGAQTIVPTDVSSTEVVALALTALRAPAAVGNIFDSLGSVAAPCGPILLSFNNEGLIVGNIIVNASGALILDGTGDVTVVGNHFVNCADAQAALRIINGTLNCNVQANTFRQGAAPAAVSIDSGCSGNLVTNNDWLGGYTGGAGLADAGTGTITIAGNRG